MTIHDLIWPAIFGGAGAMYAVIAVFTWALCKAGASNQD